MATLFEKLPASTLRQQIAERIREAILTGLLHEGERLAERTLASQFQTSWTAVREALIQLDAEGFVIKKPNSPTYVTKLSLDAAEKVFAARKVVELYAVEEAARSATPQQLQEVEKCYFDLLDAAHSKEPQAFILKDVLLHEKIWEIAGNEYVEAALRRIVLPVFAFSAIRIISHRSFDLLEDGQSHLPIVEAIKCKNPEAARSAFLTALDEWLSKTRKYIFSESTGN